MRTARPLTRGAAVLACAVAFAAWAQASVDVPSAPTRWVTDKAGMLSAPARAALDRRLQAYEQQSGHQVVVYIDRSLNGVPIEDFAVRAFEKWGVGKKGVDDGVAFFVFSEDRRLRIEVGYGFEDELPDATANRIIQELVVPRLRANDPDGAITAGVEAIVASVEGRPLPAAAPQHRVERRGARPPSPLQLVLMGLLAVGFVVLLITNPSLALFLLYSVMSGGRGGHRGGGFGGGGFGGGGGRSGGGGASGSW